jgi:DNA-binding beta-propeller fold protein YncE
MPMTSRLVFGSLGNGRNQFNSPHGFCLNPDDDIVVADTNNHRVVVISKNGDFLFQFGTAGKLDGNLFYPRKVYHCLDLCHYLWLFLGGRHSWQ